MLVAHDLTVFLDGTTILDRLDLAVEAGQWIGLVGPNGSGKTTLLRAVGGLLPYRGRLTLWGQEVRRWRPRALARRLAFLRQAATLGFDFTVIDLVLLGRAPHKPWLEGYTVTDHARARAALERVEMDAFAHRSALSLSGGELQRVFLAQALAQEADLLLLDEPTTHLDVHHQFEIMYVVDELVRSGRTVIAVFHDLELAARFSDALIVLHRGRQVAAGAPAEVLTEGLLAEVFRMHARVTIEADGHLRIRYDRPVASMPVSPSTVPMSPGR
ncbi:ABC transporter [Rhodothermaceae bacterium RA]|nr:ABC transporter [Rhodothermaceae bacterium RA]